MRWRKTHNNIKRKLRVLYITKEYLKVSRKNGELTFTLQPQLTKTITTTYMEKHKWAA